MVLLRNGSPPQRWLALCAATVSLVAFFLFIFSPSSVPVSKWTVSRHHDRYTLLDDTSNRTLGFQKIYAINLRSRKDHRDAVALSAAVTGLTVDFVDGAVGSEVADRTLPFDGQSMGLSDGVKGCWRAHMDVLYEIVSKNISSALILEDDADWDIRIKPQMRQFAQASQVLFQPLMGAVGHADTTFPKPHDNDTTPALGLHMASSVVPPLWSPYGDDWDLLWLGQCGTTFPSASRNPSLPRGRVIISDDETVPAIPYIDKHWGVDELQEQYPNHTRVVHHSSENVCTLAYAVTQSAARRLLYSLGLDKMIGPYDIGLRTFCDGLDEEKSVRNCLTVQPQLFNHHRPRGNQSSWSDINPDGTGSGILQKASTVNIRLSTRINLARLIDGRTDFIDQYPD